MRSQAELIHSRKITLIIINNRKLLSLGQNDRGLIFKDRILLKMRHNFLLPHTGILERLVPKNHKNKSPFEILNPGI